MERFSGGPRARGGAATRHRVLVTGLAAAEGAW